MLRAAAGASVSGGGGSYVHNATFTGPDTPSAVPKADTGQVWHSDSGTWGIIGNRLYCSATTGDNHGYYDSGVSDNCTITAILTLLGGNTFGLLARYQDELNHFVFTPTATGVWALYRRTAGVYTQLRQTTSSHSGDIPKIVLSGSTITPYVNGAGFASVTDSSFMTATKVGFRATGTGDRWDNLQVSVP